MLHSQDNWYPGWKLCAHIPLVKRQMEGFLNEVAEEVQRLSNALDCMNKSKKFEIIITAIVNWRRAGLWLAAVSVGGR